DTKPATDDKPGPSNDKSNPGDSTRQAPSKDTPPAPPATPAPPPPPSPPAPARPAVAPRADQRHQVRHQPQVRQQVRRQVRQRHQTAEDDQERRCAARGDPADHGVPPRQ